jgi:hypothetical protein
VLPFVNALFCFGLNVRTSKYTMTGAPNPSSKGAEDLRKFLNPVISKNGHGSSGKHISNAGHYRHIHRLWRCEFAHHGRQHHCENHRYNNIILYFSQDVLGTQQERAMWHCGHLQGLGTGLGFLSRLLKYLNPKLILRDIINTC